MCVCAHVHKVREGGVWENLAPTVIVRTTRFPLLLGPCLSFPADLLLGGFCFSLMSHDKTESARRGKDTRAPDGRSPGPGPLHAGTVPGFLPFV